MKKQDTLTKEEVQHHKDAIIQIRNAMKDYKSICEARINWHRKAIYETQKKDQ